MTTTLSYHDHDPTTPPPQPLPQLLNDSHSSSCEEAVDSATEYHLTLDRWINGAFREGVLLLMNATHQCKHQQRCQCDSQEGGGSGFNA